MIENSLRTHHGESLVPARLSPLRRAVEVFGFHLATVDLRQSSDRHERRWRNCSPSRASSRTMRPAEDEKQDCCCGCCAIRGRCGCRASLFGAHASASSPYSRPPASCAAASARGDPPLHHQPHRGGERLARGADPAKECAMMHGALGDRDAAIQLASCRCSRPFEDLRNAEPIMRAFFACPASRIVAQFRRAARNHAGLFRQQQGRRFLHQQLGALPRLDRAGEIFRRDAMALRYGCSMAAAVRSGAAAARAIRPSWRNRRAR